MKWMCDGVGKWSYELRHEQGVVMTSIIRCLVVAATVAGALPLTARAAQTSAEIAVNSRVDSQLKRTLHRLAQRASASRPNRGQVVAMRVKIEPIAINGSR
jgi:hypothetical protein